MEGLATFIKKLQKKILPQIQTIRQFLVTYFEVLHTKANAFSKKLLHYSFNQLNSDFDPYFWNLHQKNPDHPLVQFPHYIQLWSRRQSQLFKKYSTKRKKKLTNFFEQQLEPYFKPVSKRNKHLRKKTKKYSKKLKKSWQKVSKKYHRQWKRHFKYIKKQAPLPRSGVIFQQRRELAWITKNIQSLVQHISPLLLPFTPLAKKIQQLWQEIYAELIEITTPSKKSRKKGSSLAILFGELRSYLTDLKQATPRFAPLLALLLIASLLTLGGIYNLYYTIFIDLPPVSDLVERDQQVTTRILDRNGELLFRIYEDENRTLTTLDDVPDYVEQATIAIEDQTFYQHWGFSIQGIIRAAIANFQGKPVQGGSTITQQLVKNRLLTPERTLRRKLRELILAIQVDATFTKAEILEMYLNQVAYGGATYGIEEASQTYFGKSVQDVSLAEAAMLAGLPAAPSVYSPFGTNPDLAYARQEEVLRRMVEEEFITQDTAETALKEELTFRPNVIDIKAPHFVMYVRELLALQYGEDVLNQGGLEVVTTLDLPLQEEVQTKVTEEVQELERLRVSNGAALVTSPTTGEILAMVGSKDYFDFENDGQVNVTLRPRQPGSSIKPLTYAVALENGKNPYSTIDDSPVTYHTPGSPPYSPQNYDGRYHGRVTLTQALASSYNIPAVKLLAEVGVDTVIDKGEAMGITTWENRNRFGLSLTLGGGEVLMTDMAKMYGSFANYGLTTDLNPILVVKDHTGTILYKNTCALSGTNCPQRRTLDPRVAYQISEMLSDNRARTPAFGPQSVLNIPEQEVAVKTGTTNNLRDNWTIGYTTDYLVATWVGNNDNTPMSYVASGITGASPIWNEIMRLTLNEKQPHAFPLPQGMIEVAICAQTGTLTCAGCPTTVNQIFIPGTEPRQACNPAWFRPQANQDQQSTTNRNQILEGVTFSQAQ